MNRTPEDYAHAILTRIADGSARREDWIMLLDTKTPHDKQRLFIDSPAKRKVIRAGRRGGKTTGIAIAAVEYFKAGRRVLYTAPTGEQVDAFWYEVKAACFEAIEAGYLYKNETNHIIEVPGTKNRIRAKTAWDADSLRGDYGDLLIFDEWQLTDEEAWTRVGMPMLLDNNGDAVFIYTPPSLHSRSRSKARDPLHASKLFKSADQDTSGYWAAFHFTSRDNPHISAEAIDMLARDMTALAFEQEIMAEDRDEAPGALWTRPMIDDLRVIEAPELSRVVIGVDPPGTDRTECGITVAGLGKNGHGYILADYSLTGSPDTWAREVVTAYRDWKADRVVAEKNFGGDMVEYVITTADREHPISFKSVSASRGKAVRAEPIAAQYERGKVHHVGMFPKMELEMVGWEPNSNMPSPNRMDALVWALTELMLGPQSTMIVDRNSPSFYRQRSGNRKSNRPLA